MRAIVAGAVVLACVVVGLDAFAGPFFSLAARELPTAVQGQRVLGGVEGPVKSTDEPAQVIRVASGFLGLSSLAIAVTPDTTIAVDGKLGWWGDLRRGLLVRVVYEVMPDERLVASRVELLDQASAPPMHPQNGARQPDAITSEPVGVSTEAPVALSPAPSSVTAPRTASRPAVAASPPATLDRSHGEDGGAAVEWLLKESTAGR